MKRWIRVLGLTLVLGISCKQPEAGDSSLKPDQTVELMLTLDAIGSLSINQEKVVAIAKGADIKNLTVINSNPSVASALLNPAQTELTIKALTTGETTISLKDRTNNVTSAPQRLEVVGSFGLSIPPLDDLFVNQHKVVAIAKGADIKNLTVINSNPSAVSAVLNSTQTELTIKALDSGKATISLKDSANNISSEERSFMATKDLRLELAKPFPSQLFWDEEFSGEVIIGHSIDVNNLRVMYRYPGLEFNEYSNPNGWMKVEDGKLHVKIYSALLSSEKRYFLYIEDKTSGTQSPIYSYDVKGDHRIDIQKDDNGFTHEVAQMNVLRIKYSKGRHVKASDLILNYQYGNLTKNRLSVVAKDDGYIYVTGVGYELDPHKQLTAFRLNNIALPDRHEEKYSNTIRIHTVPDGRDIKQENYRYSMIPTDWKRHNVRIDSMLSITYHPARLKYFGLDAQQLLKDAEKDLKLMFDKELEQHYNQYNTAGNLKAYRPYFEQHVAKNWIKYSPKHISALDHKGDDIYGYYHGQKDSPFDGKKFLEFDILKKRICRNQW